MDTIPPPEIEPQFVPQRHVGRHYIHVPEYPHALHDLRTWFKKVLEISILEIISTVGNPPSIESMLGGIIGNKRWCCLREGSGSWIGPFGEPEGSGEDKGWSLLARALRRFCSVGPDVWDDRWDRSGGKTPKEGILGSITLPYYKVDPTSSTPFRP